MKDSTSPSPRGRQLVERFLGPSALRDGPFGLLGIDPASCTPGGIDAALQRQLDRIAAHTDAESSEADEVRLVVDTAATELLDPVTRAKWIETLRREREQEPAPSDPPKAAQLVERSPNVRQPSAEDGSPREAAIIGDPVVKRTLTAVGLGFAAMLVVTIGTAWLLSALSGPSTAPPATPKPPIGSAPARSTAPTAEQPAPPATPLEPLRVRGRSEYADSGQIVRELRGAAADMATDPDRGLARFERAFAVIGDWWCRYENASLRAAADAVVECVYRATTHPDHADRIISIITDPLRPIGPPPRGAPARPLHADESWPAAWSAGIVARLSRERDLPPRTALAVGHALDQLFADSRATGAADFTLEAGLAAGLRAAPAAMLAGPAARGDEQQPAAPSATPALARWIEAVSLTYATDPDRRERFLCEALAWMLARAPEPESDPRVFESITLLASEIKWRAGGPARPRLIEWFRDPQISNTDLRAVTSAIATRSSAEGVEPSMVLSMSARGDDRQQLRARYAAAWGLAEASTRADSAREWLARARALADFTPREDELDQLTAAADLAELSREAARIWRGESAAHGATAPAGPAAVPGYTPGASKIAQPGRVGSPTVPTGAVTGEARDGSWAERYLAAERNIPVRLDRLAELEQMGPPIGWIDAAVLTEAAFFASPLQVRTAAQKVAARFADEPALVSAFLDALPQAPRVRAVSESISRVALSALPRTSDPDWEFAARRALVERLLSMLADEGIHGQIEQLASRIAAAYLDAAGEPPPDLAADAAATGARRGAEMLSDAVRREAEGLPISSATRFNLEQIARRRDQRRRQAIGPVQAFVAEQATLAETLGYLVAAERPEREAPIAAVLDQMNESRRRARHVFAQVWAAERAIVKVWILRLGEEGQAS